MGHIRNIVVMSIFVVLVKFHTVTSLLDCSFVKEAKVYVILTQKITFALGRKAAYVNQLFAKLHCCTRYSTSYATNKREMQ